MAFLVRRDGTRLDLGSLRIPSWDGMTVNGVEHRCGQHRDTDGPVVHARCELPVGHEGPVMPRWRHVGRNTSGKWIVWENER